MNNGEIIDKLVAKANQNGLKIEQADDKGIYYNWHGEDGHNSYLYGELFFHPQFAKAIGYKLEDLGKFLDDKTHIQWVIFDFLKNYV